MPPKEGGWLPGDPTLRSEVGTFSPAPNPDLWGGERDWELNQSPMTKDFVSHA